MNELYRHLIVQRINFALSAAEVAADLEHNGVKGAMREALMSELLRPLLPPDFGVATGVIISADNEQSPQQDIIIYNKRILPPFLTDGPALIPVESVVATIEVKSTLTAEELKKAYENVTGVRRLRLLSGVYGKDGQTVDVKITDAQGNLIPRPETAPVSGVTSFLFAFASDLTTKPEPERFAEQCEDVHFFSGICIVGKGLFAPCEQAFYDYENGRHLCLEDPSHPLTNAITELQAADKLHSEVLLFITDLHRIVNKVANTRGYPPLSGYVENS